MKTWNGQFSMQDFITGCGAWLSLILPVLVVGCAMPGQLYLVMPAISGSLEGDGLMPAQSELSLIVMHRESPTLHHRSDIELPASGAFSFDRVELAVAGHEYTKFYRVFLHLRADGKNRVIWRALVSRRELAGPIELECNLDRPLSQGQRCWVDDPTMQPWLVADGERTYQRLCSSCHGSDASGAAASDTSSAGLPPDLRRIAARRNGRFDRAEIAEWIEGRSLPGSHGTRKMPVWGERLSESFDKYAEGDELIGGTLDPVLAYLESLQQYVETSP
jgi:hypothetical protein